MAHNVNMSIRSYIDMVKDEQIQRYRNQTASEVLIGSVHYDVKDWDSVMTRGGYHMVIPNKHATWESMHTWIREHIGEQHYSWNGNHFCFIA